MYTNFIIFFNSLYAHLKLIDYFNNIQITKKNAKNIEKKKYTRCFVYQTFFKQLLDGIFKF